MGINIAEANENVDLQKSSCGSLALAGIVGALLAEFITFAVLCTCKRKTAIVEQERNTDVPRKTSFNKYEKL